MPSINQVCAEFNLSRDTVINAFSELKSKGIIISQPGKGYYLATCEISRHEKVFVLFDELNAYKEELYHSFIGALKGKAHIDIDFHHFNQKNFKNLLLAGIGKYTSFIIMPSGLENISHLLAKLPSEKVFILDRLKPELKDYPVVYQDYEQDLYEAMVSVEQQLKKYRKLIFIHSGGREPYERVKGFEKYCHQNHLSYQVVKSLDSLKPALYEAWFVTSDNDLAHLVKMAKSYKLKIGKKFGIVSFNDTVLKEVVAGGITTISTDYSEMGKNLAFMLLNHNRGQIRNPSRLILRKSL